MKMECLEKPAFFHKITLKEFRLLLDIQPDSLWLSVGNELLPINKYTFDGIDKVDRKTIHSFIKVVHGIDTTKWRYYSDETGCLLINKIDF
jgi:hypothetical protein